MKFRLQFVFLLIVIWVVIILGRLFSLQVKDYGTFAAFARGQQQVSQDIAPERGTIFGQDADGTTVPLATNRDWPRVYAVPKDIDDLQRVLGSLRDVLGFDDAKMRALEDRLSQKEDPYEPIAEHLSDEQAAKLKEANLKGIRLAAVRGRYYPQGQRLAHVLGFVGNDGKMQRGLYGLEAGFDEELRGVPGKLRGERDGRGRVLEAFSENASLPQPGAAITLTIDPNVQYQAEKFLHEMLEEWKATGGSVIVLDPHSGAVRAMANEPTFDPNRYGEAKDNSVFTNPAVTVPYEPGSVFKAITMATALDSGAVVPETTFTNTGSIQMAGYTISNTLQQYNGVRTMIDVLRYSLNTGAVFAEEQTGHETFHSYVQAFGFGKPTDVGLSPEASGSLKNLSSGRPINFATASFGQGISTTPMQLASAFGAIANGGVLMKPYIVERIDYPDGTFQETAPREVRRVIQQRTATRLSAMMTRVIEDGSGARAKIPGYTIAGKTGTAEIPNVGSAGYGSGNIHTFIGFFPAFDPRYVILTKVDKPQGVRYAESTAVPMFRHIAEFLITYSAIPPDQPISGKSK